jgi:hypothetical protein
VGGALREICDRFSSLGLAMEDKLRSRENVKAACWDAPVYLQGVLDALEQDFTTVVADLRATIDRMQSAKEKFVKEAR